MACGGGQDGVGKGANPEIRAVLQSLPSLARLPGDPHDISWHL